MKIRLALLFMAGLLTQPSYNRMFISSPYFTASSSKYLYDAKPIQYFICPVHGKLSGINPFTLSITYKGQTTYYCILCIKELLDKSIPQLEVKEEHEEY